MNGQEDDFLSDGLKKFMVKLASHERKARLFDDNETHLNGQRLFRKSLVVKCTRFDLPTSTPRPLDFGGNFIQDSPTLSPIEKGGVIVISSDEDEDEGEQAVAVNKNNNDLQEIKTEATSPIVDGQNENEKNRQLTARSRNYSRTITQFNVNELDESDNEKKKESKKNENQDNERTLRPLRSRENTVERRNHESKIEKSKNRIDESRNKENVRNGELSRRSRSETQNDKTKNATVSKEITYPEMLVSKTVERCREIEVQTSPQNEQHGEEPEQGEEEQEECPAESDDINISGVIPLAKGPEDRPEKSGINRKSERSRKLSIKRLSTKVVQTSLKKVERKQKQKGKRIDASQQTSLKRERDISSTYSSSSSINSIIPKDNFLFESLPSGSVEDKPEEPPLPWRLKTMNLTKSQLEILKPTCFFGRLSNAPPASQFRKDRRTYNRKNQHQRDSSDTDSEKESDAENDSDSVDFDSIGSLVGAKPKFQSPVRNVDNKTNSKQTKIEKLNNRNNNNNTEKLHKSYNKVTKNEVQSKSKRVETCRRDKHERIRQDDYCETSPNRKDVEVTHDNELVESSQEDEHVEISPEKKRVELNRKNENVETTGVDYQVETIRNRTRKGTNRSTKHCETSPVRKRLGTNSDNEHAETSREDENVETIREDEHVEMSPIEKRVESNRKNRNVGTTGEDYHVETVRNRTRKETNRSTKHCETSPVRKRLGTNSDNGHAETSREDENVETIREDEHVEMSPIEKRVESNRKNKNVGTTGEDYHVETVRNRTRKETNRSTKHCETSPVRKRLGTNSDNGHAETSREDENVETIREDEHVEMSPIEKRVESNRKNRNVGTTGEDYHVETVRNRTRNGTNRSTKHTETSPIRKHVRTTRSNNHCKVSPIRKNVETIPAVQPRILFEKERSVRETNKSAQKASCSASELSTPKRKNKIRVLEDIQLNQQDESAQRPVLNNDKHKGYIREELEEDEEEIVPGNDVFDNYDITDGANKNLQIPGRSNRKVNQNQQKSNKVTVVERKETPKRKNLSRTRDSGVNDLESQITTDSSESRGKKTRKELSFNRESGAVIEELPVIEEEQDIEAEVGNEKKSRSRKRNASKTKSKSNEDDLAEERETDAVQWKKPKRINKQHKQKRPLIRESSSDCMGSSIDEEGLRRSTRAKRTGILHNRGVFIINNAADTRLFSSYFSSTTSSISESLKTTTLLTNNSTIVNKRTKTRGGKKKADSEHNEVDSKNKKRTTKRKTLDRNDSEAGLSKINKDDKGRITSTEQDLEENQEMRNNKRISKSSIREKTTKNALQTEQQEVSEEYQGNHENPGNLENREDLFNEVTSVRNDLVNNEALQTSPLRRKTNKSVNSRHHTANVKNGLRKNLIEMTPDQSIIPSTTSNDYLDYSFNGRTIAIRWCSSQFGSFSFKDERNPDVGFAMGANNPVNKSAVGMMIIKPGGVKLKQVTSFASLYFIVKQGRVEVELGERKLQLKEEGSFTVPKGFEYSLKNLSKTQELQLHFFRFVDKTL